jgi:predicted hydrocarbon binding protein
MKGIVFTTLANMVEEQFGLVTWQKILDQANPESGGIYVGTATYSDEEMMSLVATASEQLKIPINDLVKHYGKYLWATLASSQFQFVEQHDNLKDFLLSVHSVIHIEVKKLYPGAYTPDFRYESKDAEHLTMHYQSPRKLCYLAEGLIEGAAEHYQSSYTLDHDQCMHDGAEHCTFELSFSNGRA